MKSYHLSTAVVLVSLMIPVEAYAWDGKREGFIFGLGLGGGVMSNSTPVNPDTIFARVFGD